MLHLKLRNKVLAICLLIPFMVACTPLERQAYNTIVGAKAFLDAEKKMHPECVNGTGMAFCGKLAQATAAKDVLIDAAEIYCSGPQFEAGGVCQAPVKGTPGYEQAVAKLKAAIASYNQLQLDLKGTVK